MSNGKQHIIKPNYDLLTLSGVEAAEKAGLKVIAISQGVYRALSFMRMGEYDNFSDIIQRLIERTERKPHSNSSNNTGWRNND
jgi:hypothetical protein